ncbi:unnamed protein product [Eruca vesicaria subsp. sativa]|uniref:TFIIS N-terminal domain-containing protein n=1 Tax=Eruca vesicaria subsp. sativa TaxID=29727 RepID=A0ABC8LB53_ERUVS|nr:unnamed protein product [Eruca vesicaria subsp. sativa]
MVAQEISDDLQALFVAAIEASYLTRDLGGIERCVDLLNRLKSKSLSVSDIQRFSKSIFRLETLRTHKNPKIREVSQSLFHSWLATLYAQGRDQSLKPKKKNLVPTECSKKEHRSISSLEPKEEIKKKTGLVELKTETQRDNRDKDGKVTTKTLLPPPKRVASCANPNSAAKTEEMLELFEAAKKAADVANAKGILSGKADASRCVEAISLLMKMNVTPKPNEPRRIMERLQGLTKHKDRTICNAASSLLQLWRQRIKEGEAKAASTIDMILSKPCGAHQIRGQSFTREPTKKRKLVM